MLLKNSNPTVSFFTFHHVSNRFKDQLITFYEFDHVTIKRDIIKFCFTKTPGVPSRVRYQKTNHMWRCPIKPHPKFLCEKTHIWEISHIWDISQPWIVWERHCQHFLSSVVTPSSADSPRSIRQVFNGLWPIFYVFFCRTKSLKVVFDRPPIAYWWNLSFHFQFTSIQSLISGVVCKKNTNADVVAKIRGLSC